MAIFLGKLVTKWFAAIRSKNLSASQSIKCSEICRFFFSYCPEMDKLKVSKGH